MKKFSIVSLFILTIIFTSSVNIHASEIESYTSYSHTVGCGKHFEMPEKVDYHCTFNSGNYDQVFAKVTSWEDNFSSHVESETGVWLEKEDAGANTLMCRNDEHLDGDNYVDDVKCSNTSSGNVQ